MSNGSLLLTTMSVTGALFLTRGSSVWSRMQQFFLEGRPKTHIVTRNALCFYP